MYSFKFGGHSELVPRLPIPNRTVKRLSADDSVVLPCESRSLPNTILSPDRCRGLLLCIVSVWRTSLPCMAAVEWGNIPDDPVAEGWALLMWEEAAPELK